jgi:hypothetical protein
MNEKQVKQHVPIIGMLHLVGGILFALAGIFIFLFLGGIGAVTDDPTAFRILGITGLTVGVFLVILSIPGIAAGYGLLRGRHWARSLAIAVGILQLINFPIGTIIGIYTFIVLAPSSAEEYFVSLEGA